MKPERARWYVPQKYHDMAAEMGPDFRLFDFWEALEIAPESGTFSRISASCSRPSAPS